MIKDCGLFAVVTGILCVFALTACSSTPEVDITGVWQGEMDLGEGLTNDLKLIITDGPSDDGHAYIEGEGFDDVRVSTSSSQDVRVEISTFGSASYRGSCTLTGQVNGNSMFGDVKGGIYPIGSNGEDVDCGRTFELHRNN